ncbi:MAG: hypothetical protein V4665_01435 [Patescibacteria group bacterium]
MKKIIVGIFSLALLLASHSAFASWNTEPNDCKSISIINATTNQGYQNPCWPLSSVSARPGDVINVRIYYHNTGTQAANTRIVLSAPSMASSSSSKSFTGRIVSDQGSLSFGPVTANLSSSQSLTFISSKWYTENTNETLTPLLGGQSGSEVLTENGLDIGSIAPGWSTQGSVVIAFRVSSSNSTVQTCQDSSATNFGGPLPCTYGNQSQMSGTLTANPSYCTIPAGSSTCSTILAWNTLNPVSTSAVTTPGLGTVATGNSGSQQVNVPYGNQVFYLYNNGQLLHQATVNASCGSGSSWNGSSCVSTQVNNCYISNFTASQTQVSQGSSVTINWNTQNCTSVNVYGPGGLNSNSTSGNQTVYPNSGTNTYTITANGQNGAAQTQSLSVYVNQTSNCTISNFTANGSSSAYITSGSPVTISWNAGNFSYVTVSGPGLNSNSLSGSQVIYPTYSGTYTLTASGSNCGNQTRSVQVNVNNTIIPQPPVVVAACAVTTIATNVTQTTAILNGLVSGTPYGSVTGYFEYGPTVAMGLRTPTRTMNVGPITEIVSGLAPNTIYYFRFSANCGNGFSSGAIQTLSTLGAVRVVTTTTNPVVVQGTTVIGTQSPIMLTIENRYEFLGVGDTVDYTVTYRNIGRSLLTRPVLQVVVPKGVVITNASRGTYSVDTNTLTVPLEDLLPGAGGTVYLQGRVDLVAPGDAQIVTTAILVYTNPNGAQENAIAYALNRPKDNNTINTLGASAFFGGIFPSTLLGWLLLLLLILLLILATRRYYNRRPVVVQPPHGPMTH